MRALCLLALICLSLSPVVAQEAQETPAPDATSETSADSPPANAGSEDANESETTGPESTVSENTGPETTNGDTLEQAKESATGLVNDATERVGELTETLDQNRTVQDVSTGLLHPIYVAAKAIAFPTFHWLAFALMAAGVVSYTFQLVLGKLVVLTKGSINVREIISDFVSLMISTIGLILTTQAATESSSFPNSPTAVLSSAVVGVIVGLVLYRWNQAEEVDAAHGRRHQNK